MDDAFSKDRVKGTWGNIVNLTKITKVAKPAVLSVIVTWFGLSVSAQAEDTVTIQFDGGLGITGVLVEATETAVRLETLSGVVTIPLEGATCIGAACPGAQETTTEDRAVVLTSLDGATKMEGDLVRVESGDYVLSTIIGEMRAPVDQVTCIGTGCVEPTPEPVLGGKVILSSGDTILQGILKGLNDENYLVEVALFGELSVPRAFDCKGEGCPPE